MTMRNTPTHPRHPGNDLVWVQDWTECPEDDATAMLWIESGLMDLQVRRCDLPAIQARLRALKPAPKSITPDPVTIVLVALGVALVAFLLDATGHIWQSRLILAVAAAATAATLVVEIRQQIKERGR